MFIWLVYYLKLRPVAYLERIEALVTYWQILGLRKKTCQGQTV